MKILMSIYIGVEMIVLILYFGYPGIGICASWIAEERGGKKSTSQRDIDRYFTTFPMVISIQSPILMISTIDWLQPLRQSTICF